MSLCLVYKPIIFLFFFFSSRRRHTRWNCDWSSDVCSSDLRALTQMHTLRGTAPADSILTTSIAKRTQKLGLEGGYGTDAARFVAAEVYPALDRQMQALGELRPAAVHEAGVSRLPQGGELYAVALRQAITTDMSPDEVHQLGLAQGKEISARMDALLRKQGKKT